MQPKSCLTVREWGGPQWEVVVASENGGSDLGDLRESLALAQTFSAPPEPNKDGVNNSVVNKGWDVKQGEGRVVANGARHRLP